MSLSLNDLNNFCECGVIIDHYCNSAADDSNESAWNELGSAYISQMPYIISKTGIGYNSENIFLSELITMLFFHQLM